MRKLKDLPKDTNLRVVKVRLSDALYEASSLPTYGIKSKDVFLMGYTMGDFFVKTNRESDQIYPMFNDLLGWDQLKDLEVIEIHEKDIKSS